MEEIRNVTTQQADMKCPSCDNGYMRPNGIVKPTTPPWFTHKCTQCDHTQDYGVRYPHIIN